MNLIVENHDLEKQEQRSILEKLSRYCSRLKLLIEDNQGNLDDFELIQLIRYEHPYKYQAVIESFYFDSEAFYAKFEEPQEKILDHKVKAQTNDQELENGLETEKRVDSQTAPEN